VGWGRFSKIKLLGWGGGGGAARRGTPRPALSLLILGVIDAM